MRRGYLISTGTLAIIASLILSEAAGYLLDVFYAAQYSGKVDDTNVMIWGFFVAFIYTPVVAGSGAPIIALIGQSFVGQHMITIRPRNLIGVSLLAIGLIGAWSLALVSNPTLAGANGALIALLVWCVLVLGIVGVRRGSLIVISIGAVIASFVLNAILIFT